MATTKINQISLNRVNLNAIGIYKKKAPSISYEDYLANGVDILQIMNAKENSISSFVLNGATYQDSVPTPTTPLPLYCNLGAISYGVKGDNLLEVKDSNIVVGKYINNNGAITSSSANIYFQRYIYVKPNTAYTLSTSRSINYANFMEYDANGVFIKRTLYGSSSAYVGTSVTHTTGETTAFVIVGSNVDSVTFPEITKADVKSIKWMFNEGDTALAYKDYSDGFSYSNDSNVYIYGKNLSVGELVGKGYASTGGVSTSTTFCGNLHKFPVKEGQKYTVSWGNIPDGVSGVFINTWYIDGSWRQRQAISATDSLTYTIPAGVGEVNFTLYKTGGLSFTDDSWLQVELGDTVTEYRPAVEPSKYPIDILFSCNDLVDTKDLVNASITRRIGIEVLDGTENISTTNQVFTIGISDKMRAKSELYCTHFSYSTKTSSNVEDNKIISFASVNIGISHSSSADIESFRQFLQKEYAKGTPVMIIYPLQEEIVENKTTQQLTNPAGDVTIIYDNVVSGNMEVMLKVEKADEPNDEPVTKIIEFTIKSDYYGELHLQADEGMTWIEFCNSQYNTYGFYYDVSNIWIYEYNEGWSYYSEWLPGIAEDIIEDNGVYETLFDSSGGL